ncbi:hypothetical protein MAUB1S_10345 [Mycolicibacterium aubagnense]
MHLDVVVLVPADRHVVERHVRNDGKDTFECLIEPAFLGFTTLYETLDLGDFSLQLFSQLGILRAECLADLLGRRVAALLCLLQPAEMGATGFVPGDDVVDGGLGVGLRPRALHERFDQGLRVFANPSDIEHVHPS